MAWMDHQNGGWEPRDRGWSAGDILYWLATIVAALMLVFIIADLFISWGQGQPILRIFALATAVLVWLIGRACRALFS